MTFDQTDEAIYSKLREVVAETLRIPVEQVTPDARFLEDLGATSLDLATLVMILEEDLCVELPLEEMQNVSRVSDIVQFIRDRAPLN